MLRRDRPFGVEPREAKRSLYRIADPFVDFSCRYVEPNRSRLGAGQLTDVRRVIEAHWPHHLGRWWEELARASVARLRHAMMNQPPRACVVKSACG